MVSEDVLEYMPKILRQEATVHIIQSRDHILNTYSESISKYAEERFARNEIDTVVNARVKEVTSTSVTYTTKDKDGKTIEHTIPSGFTLWSTGIGVSLSLPLARSCDTVLIAVVENSDESFDESRRRHPSESIPQACSRGGLPPASSRSAARHGLRDWRLRDD